MSAWGDFVTNVFGFSHLDAVEIRKRRLAIDLVLWSAALGAVNSAIFLFLGHYEGTYVAIGYVVFTVINLLILYLFRHYHFFKVSQLSLLFLLPIFSHIFTGGYINSGNVIIASFLASFGALIFLNSKSGRILYACSVLSIIGVSIYDLTISNTLVEIPREISITILTSTIIFTFSIVYFVMESFVIKANNYQAILEDQNKKVESLLLNVLPKTISDELQETGKVKAKGFASATVVFSDFVSFSSTTKLLTPGKLVEELDIYFRAFDDIIGKYGLEKIKTIGDNYMFAGGIPEENHSHAIDAVKAGLEMQKAVSRIAMEGKVTFPFKLRIGVHSGPLVAGVVGKRKFTYDVWGDTVNIAARIEQNGISGKVAISESTYHLVNRSFNCSLHGEVQAKNVGEVALYIVEEF